MSDLQTLLADSARLHHNHLCPRQVIGVRMGMYAAELFQLDLPQTDKRLFAFVETDGCLTDGIGAATGCWFGRRTMYLMDYGKTAATIADTETGRAFRLTPTREARMRAPAYAPKGLDHWHAQLQAYQVMPVTELLDAAEVTLTVSMENIISQHGLRVVCAECGEDIINQREVYCNGQVLCRACADGAYYMFAADHSFVPTHLHFSRVAQKRGFATSNLANRMPSKMTRETMSGVLQEPGELG